MSEVGCDIVEYLKEFHTSEGKAVKARELCVLFNVHEKQLRNIVSDLRQNGEAICSSTYGYWYSRDPDDISTTLGLNCLREIQDKYLASSGENCVLMVYNMGERGAKKLWAKDIYSSVYSREVIARAQELRQELTQE